MGSENNNLYNKIVTTATTVTSDYSVVPNKCIVIDTSNNRIGINTKNPEYSIDISQGFIKTDNIILDISNINNFDVSINSNDLNNKKLVLNINSLSKFNFVSKELSSDISDISINFFTNLRQDEYPNLTGNEYNITLHKDPDSTSDPVIDISNIKTNYYCSRVPNSNINDPITVTNKDIILINLKIFVVTNNITDNSNYLFSFNKYCKH